MEKLPFDKVIKVNNNELTKKYIQSLSYDEREDLVEPVYELFRKHGMSFPDDENKIIKSYKKLCDFEPDLSSFDVFNNSSLATDICKHFCPSFYNSTEKNKKTISEVFKDDDLLRRLIRNRFGMDWLMADEKGEGVNEAFNFSPKMLIQGMRSMRLVPAISMFKPGIAKLICMKYSKPGDLVGDYSAGFGGRLLGAMSCGRRYQGTDPLTTSELKNMAKFFNFKNVELINSGSENYKGKENSVDLYWSSLPYFSQEYYSKDKSQAYNNGEDYFYNVYWKETLSNVKFMLKPGRWFGVNVKNYPEMVSMAEDIFGPCVEKIALRTVRSHLNKKAGTFKKEYVYMFKNNK